LDDMGEDVGLLASRIRNADFVMVMKFRDQPLRQGKFDFGGIGFRISRSWCVYFLLLYPNKNYPFSQIYPINLGLVSIPPKMEWHPC
jgi:hypothetical protein